MAALHGGLVLGIQMFVLRDVSTVVIIISSVGWKWYLQRLDHLNLMSQSLERPDNSEHI